jgi:hypothetical protein
MTVALYPRRKGWQLEKTVVQLGTPEFMRQTARIATKAGRLDRVEWTLQFWGSLDRGTANQAAGNRADVSCPSNAHRWKPLRNASGAVLPCWGGMMSTFLDVAWSTMMSAGSPCLLNAWLSVVLLGGTVAIILLSAARGRPAHGRRPRRHAIPHP